jgi:hypothetical protein
VGGRSWAAAVWYPHVCILMGWLKVVQAVLGCTLYGRAFHSIPGGLLSSELWQSRAVGLPFSIERLGTGVALLVGCDARTRITSEWRQRASTTHAQWGLMLARVPTNLAHWLVLAVDMQILWVASHSDERSSKPSMSGGPCMSCRCRCNGVTSQV